MLHYRFCVPPRQFTPVIILNWLCWLTGSTALAVMSFLLSNVVLLYKLLAHLIIMIDHHSSAVCKGFTPVHITNTNATHSNLVGRKVMWYRKTYSTMWTTPSPEYATLCCNRT
jgi:hypothetical protein